MILLPPAIILAGIAGLYYYAYFLDGTEVVSTKELLLEKELFGDNKIHDAGEGYIITKDLLHLEKCGILKHRWKTRSGTEIRNKILNRKLRKSYANKKSQRRSNSGKPG